MVSRTSVATDFLEQHFGPVHAHILRQDESVRIITVETEKTNRVLECAVVRFLPQVATKYPEIHARIVGGELMGKTFRAAGISFVRNELACVVRPLDGTSSRLFAGATGLVTLKYVDICVGSDQEVYAHNLELYSPLVPWPAGQFGYEQHASAIDALYALLSSTI